MIEYDFNKIFNRGIIDYAEIVCENIINTAPELIDDLLLKVRSMEMFQLLVDHGANYKKIYKTTTHEKQKNHSKNLLTIWKTKNILMTLMIPMNQMIPMIPIVLVILIVLKILKTLKILIIQNNQLFFKKNNNLTIIYGFI